MSVLCVIDIGDNVEIRKTITNGISQRYRAHYGREGEDEADNEIGGVYLAYKTCCSHPDSING